MYKYITRQVTNLCSTVCERNADYLDTAHRERMLDAAFKCLDANNQKRIIKTALMCLEQRMRTRGDELNNGQIAADYCKLRFAGEKNEIFGCLFLDSKNRVLSFEKLFFGTINAAVIHPRVVVQKALAVNAANVICTHNHVSGTAEPSKADIEVTKRLKEALALVDVTLLDHLIVGSDNTTSLMARGYLL